MTRHIDHDGKDDAVVLFIETIQREQFRPAALREVGDAFNISSPSVVKRMLDRLVAEGRLIHWGKGRRGYMVPDEKLIQRASSYTAHLARMMAEYRAICAAAGIDPQKGAVTEFQSIRAVAEARKRRKRRAVRFQWWYFDWSEPGRCRSKLEYDTFYRLFRSSYHIRKLRRAMRYVCYQREGDPVAD